MSCFGKACVLASVWLVAATVFSVADAADIHVSDVAAATPLASPSVREQEAAPTSQPKSGNPLWDIPLEQLSATRDRPLFSPSRRPPPVADAPVQAVVDPPVQAPREPERPQLSLVGTVVNGDDGFAIFVDQAKAPLRIRMGADYRGWMLRRIEARSVTLQKDKEVAVLSFAPATSHSDVAGSGSAETRPDLPAPVQPAASTVQRTPPYLSPESGALRMPARHSRRR